MNDYLLNRREILVRHIVRGLPVKVAAEEMTKDVVDVVEREKQINAICRDWGNRGKWLNNVVRLCDRTFLSELVAGMDEAMRRCWVEYSRGDNSSARVGALRTIIMGKTRVGLLLMKAGIISQVPQQVEASVTVAGTPFDVDPEMRRALLESAERQRLEKEKQNVKS